MFVSPYITLHFLCGIFHVIQCSSFCYVSFGIFQVIPCSSFRYVSLGIFMWSHAVHFVMFQVIHLSLFCCVSGGHVLLIWVRKHNGFDHSSKVNQKLTVKKSKHRGEPIKKIMIWKLTHNKNANVCISWDMKYTRKRNANVRIPWDMKLIYNQNADVCISWDMKLIYNQNADVCISWDIKLIHGRNAYVCISWDVKLILPLGRKQIQINNSQ